MLTTIKSNEKLNSTAESRFVGLVMESQMKLPPATSQGGALLGLDQPGGPINADHEAPRHFGV